MNEGELGYGVKGGGVESLVSGLTVTAANRAGARRPVGRPAHSHSKNYLASWRRWRRRRRRHCDGGRVRMMSDCVSASIVAAHKLTDTPFGCALSVPC